MQTRPKRGRPPTVDRDHVSDVALRLFEKNGFEAVSMDEIADAAKIARRTLFRLFPSKSALVWDGLTGVLGDVQARLAQRRAPATLDELVEHVFRPTFRWLETPDVAALARRRLRLIGSAPGLLTHPALGQLQGILTEAVSRVADVDAPAELVARSLVAVGFGALLWWAEEGGQVSPVEAFDAAIRSLAQVQRARLVAPRRRRNAIKGGAAR